MRDVQVAYLGLFSLDLQSQKKVAGKVVQLNSSPFNAQKESFLFC